MSDKISSFESARRDWEEAAASAPKYDYAAMSDEELVNFHDRASDDMEGAGMPEFVHAELAICGAWEEMKRRGLAMR